MTVDPKMPTETTSTIDGDRVWKNALSVLEKGLNEQAFKTWVQAARFLEVRERSLVLEVPDKFYVDWISEHYGEAIQAAVGQVSENSLNARFVPSATPQQVTLLRSAPSEVRNAVEIDGRYTFENFVIGPGNRFAHAAALAVSDAPAKNYNPLQDSWINKLMRAQKSSLRKRTLLP